MNLQRLFFLCFLALLSACSTTSVQEADRPNLSVDLEDSTMARVYFLRKPQVYGSKMTVSAYADALKIGTIAKGSYLCWEQEPGEIVIRVVFERRTMDGGPTESFIGLEAEPGRAYYCVVDLEWQGGKPKVEWMDPERARKLMDDQEPAPEE